MASYLKSGNRLWIGMALSLTFAQLAASVLVPPGYGLTAISDIISCLLILSVVLAFARNAVSARDRLRSVWTLQAASWSFWLLDQLAWTYYDVILRRPLPEMFPGDVILFLSGVPMLAGLTLRPHLEPSHRSVRLGMLDFLQLMLWWIFLYAYLVMCWQFVTADSGLYNRNYDRLYLVEVLALLIVLGSLLRQTTGPWKRFYAYFLGTVVFNALAVVAENTALERKMYYNGCWYDIPFVASFAFFIGVALKGRGLTPAPESGEDRKYGYWMAGFAMAAVLSLPIILVATVLDRGQPAEIVRFRLLITAIAMFLMAALVFVKQRRLHEELKQTNQVLEQASVTDPLTGIRNRRYFSETIEADVAQALRAHTERRPDTRRDLIFYLIDLDNFKQVNDLYGHDAGDRVLVETASRLGSVVRDSDVLLRWGGEEFLIVSRSADRREADAVALRVMQAVRSQPFQLSPLRSIARTCSIGWAAFPWREDDPNAMGYEDVLNMADRALGQAKRAGKDQAIGMTPPRDGSVPPLHFPRHAAASSLNPDWHNEPADLRAHGGA